MSSKYVLRTKLLAGMQEKPTQCSIGSCGISYMCQKPITVCTLFVEAPQGACTLRRER